MEHVDNGGGSSVTRTDKGRFYKGRVCKTHKELVETGQQKAVQSWKEGQDVQCVAEQHAWKAPNSETREKAQGVHSQDVLRTFPTRRVSDIRLFASMCELRAASYFIRISWANNGRNHSTVCTQHHSVPTSSAGTASTRAATDNGRLSFCPFFAHCHDDGNDDFDDNATSIP